MSTEAMRELETLASVCPELNIVNYTEDDVSRLNDWAIEMSLLVEKAAAIQQAEAQQPATPEPVAWFEYSEQHKSWFLAYTRNPHVLTRPLVFGDTNPAPGVPDDVARDAISLVREQYRGTDWGKAAECVCDAIDDAMTAAQAQKGGA